MLPNSISLHNHSTCTSSFSRWHSSIQTVCRLPLEAPSSEAELPFLLRARFFCWPAGVTFATFDAFILLRIDKGLGPLALCRLKMVFCLRACASASGFASASLCRCKSHDKECWFVEDLHCQPLLLQMRCALQTKHCPKTSVEKPAGPDHPAES